MGAYDTMTAGLSGAGLALLSIITVHGTSDYHLNAEQMQASLQSAAEQALVDAGHTWASVKMAGQTARLSGTPPTERAAEEALELVQSSSGPGGLIWGGVIRVETAFGTAEPIAAVERAVEVAEVAPMAAPAAADAPYVWRAIKSPKGSLILVGSVPSEIAHDALAGHAAAVSQDALDNRMEIMSGAPGADWSETARFSLDQLALLNSGEVRLTGNEVRISGIAMDDRARIQATASVANLKAPWRGVARIDGPSSWTAEQVNGALVLSGACATPEARVEITEIAQAYFDGQVVDQMTVGSVEQSGWVEYVSLDPSSHSQFKSGEADRAPDGDGFKGQEWSE